VIGTLAMGVFLAVVVAIVLVALVVVRAGQAGRDGYMTRLDERAIL
jgi:hypothetical protein